MCTKSQFDEPGDRETDIHMTFAVLDVRVLCHVFRVSESGTH
jgi:hypothetical protein